MEIYGKWTKDEEGFMEFDSSQVQRYFETITDEYHNAYNQCVEATDDEEDAYFDALDRGYEMVTDYKDINGVQEFVTSYMTPGFVLDVWYETDPNTGKRLFDRGFVRIRQKG